MEETIKQIDEIYAKVALLESLIEKMEDMKEDLFRQVDVLTEKL